MAAGRTSATYALESEAMAFGGGYKSSATFTLFSSYSDLSVGSISSTSYSIREGWLPTSFAPFAMLVTSIDPSEGYNTGAIDITDISGSGFASGASVSLTMTGESDIAATNVQVVSGTQITCTFDLTGARTGLWNLVVADPGGFSDTLPAAFRVRTWASQSLAVNHPNPFNPLSGPTTIIYQLAADTDIALLIFNISHELVYKQDFASGTSGGQAGDNSVVWNGYNSFNELSASGVYFLRVVDRRAGKVLARGKIAVQR